MPEPTNPGYAAVVAADQLVIVMDGAIYTVSYVDEPDLFEQVLLAIIEQYTAKTLLGILNVA